MPLRQPRVPRFTVAVSVGPWGGFYVHRKFFQRVCIGWLAITVVPVELDDLMDAYAAAVEKRAEAYEDGSERERLRNLSVDECPECDGGRMVRYCSIHGLHGSAPR